MHGVKLTLVLLVAVVVVSGIRSGRPFVRGMPLRANSFSGHYFQRHFQRQVPTIPEPETTAPTVTEPTMPFMTPRIPREMPLKVDLVFLKYALGMGKIDPVVDPEVTFGAYYDVFKAMPDSQLITKQLMRTLGLSYLQKQSDCFTTQSMQLIVFGIAASLQKRVGEKIHEIEPEIGIILPDAAANNLKDTVPEILGELLIKSTIVSFLPKLFPDELFELESIIKNGLEKATTPDEFTGFMANFMANTQIPCPDLFTVARILKEQIPKLNDVISSEMLPIIARVRSILKLKGIVADNLPGIEKLFKTMKPIVAKVVMDVNDLTKGEGDQLLDNLKEFIQKILRLDIPTDLRTPMLQNDTVQAKTLKIFTELTSTPGPLNGLIVRIRGELTDAPEY